MIINITLTDGNGTPITGATITHTTENCCEVPATVTEKPGGIYEIKLMTTQKNPHILTITAAGYEPRTVQIGRGLMELDIWNREISLDALSWNPEETDTGEPGIGGNNWKLPDWDDRKAVYCSAIAVSTKKPCRHKTKEEFCFQHKQAVTPGMKLYTGKWKMLGSQLNVEHSGWEADLDLQADGVAVWKETKGANVGASRKGYWLLQDNHLLIRYMAPRVGRVEWNTLTLSPSAMQGDYKTPDAGPGEYGWGGQWSAMKLNVA